MPAEMSWISISHGKKDTQGSSSNVVRISTVLTATDDVIVWGMVGGVNVVVVGRDIWFNQIFYLTLLSMPNLRNRLTHECSIDEGVR